MEKQKLVFHPSWDKTLSIKDRTKIQQSFCNNRLPSNKAVHFTILWRANNYNSELLVTVIIHNFSSKPFLLDGKTIQYMEEDRMLAEHTFSIPTIIVDGHTSMPWTFIFPIGSFGKHASMEHCSIVLGS